MELLSGAYDPKEQKLIERTIDNFTVIAVTERQWYTAGTIMMKLRKRKKIDPLRIKGALADILIAVSSKCIGAVLITKNEKDFELIREVFDFRFLAV